MCVCVKEVLLCPVFKWSFQSQRSKGQWASGTLLQVTSLLWWYTNNKQVKVQPTHTLPIRWVRIKSCSVCVWPLASEVLYHALYYSLYRSWRLLNCRNLSHTPLNAGRTALTGFRVALHVKKVSYRILIHVYKHLQNLHQTRIKRNSSDTWPSCDLQPGGSISSSYSSQSYIQSNCSTQRRLSHTHTHTSLNK